MYLYFGTVTNAYNLIIYNMHSIFFTIYLVQVCLFTANCFITYTRKYAYVGWDSLYAKSMADVWEVYFALYLLNYTEDYICI